MVKQRLHQQEISVVSWLTFFCEFVAVGNKIFEKNKKIRGNGYFLVFGYHWLRSDLQKGQDPLVSRSWLPQFGQKTLAAELRVDVVDVSVGIEVSFVVSWALFCLRVFWDTPD